MRRGGAAGAPALFVLLWSTGFVGAKYGLPYAEPFTFLSLRLAIAAVLLAGLAAVTRSALPAAAVDYRSAAVVGLLLHAFYLGGVFSAIWRGVPAGVAAVVTSLQPVLVAALAPRLLAERLLPRQRAGLVVGLAGVALVVGPGVAARAGQPDALSPTGIAFCLVGVCAGTAGTIYQKRHGGGIPLLSGTAVQYAAAATLLLLGALSTETMHIRWTAQFVGAMVWLVLGLSLGAVLLLLALLRLGGAVAVSSLFYLVPPATAVEAYLVFGERLAPLSLFGVAVAAAGVALVVTPARVAVPP